jgi:hypothetical protein
MSSLIAGLAEEVPRYPEPPRRTLRVFAFDPMVARLSGTETVTLAVPYEPLSPGANGELLQVIDYDGVEGCYYEPVDLDDPRICYKMVCRRRSATHGSTSRWSMR